MRAIRFRILSALLVLGVAWAQVPPPVSLKNGFLYQPGVGSFWDPSVIYANNRYYMYTMYGGDGVWLATSDDGVHWKTTEWF